jgi:hypothetical protein
MFLTNSFNNGTLDNRPYAIDFDAVLVMEKTEGGGLWWGILLGTSADGSAQVQWTWDTSAARDTVWDTLLSLKGSQEV